MVLRAYQPSDCETLARLFYDTVHSVNAADYSEEQLNAWADGQTDLEAWNRSLSEHFSVVAVRNGRIVGFGDIDRSGYLDRLFVHRDYLRQGIASDICNALEHAFSVRCITTHASITARPFFEKRGYRMLREQRVERSGVWLTNFLMQRQCAPET